MKGLVSGLIVCVCLAGALYQSPALAARNDQRLDALSEEVEALKAGQADIKAQLATITKLLGGESVAGPSEAPASDAETAALRKELEAMKQVVASYKEREEKARLARLPVRPIDFTLDVSQDPYKGSDSAQIALVEFTDYQCPFCGRHDKQVLPQLLENYVETGKVRYVVRDFPLAMHKNAPKAAEAAHCAGEQGVYWPMHDELFANQKALSADKLPAYAEAAGVADIGAFQSCLANDRYAERAQKSEAEGAKAGVSGTPSFLLGVLEPDGSVKAVRFIRGAQSYAVFQDALDELLKGSDG